MNILFVHLPTVPLIELKKRRTGKFTDLYIPLSIPLGITYLSAVLKKETTHTVGLLDLMVDIDTIQEYPSVGHYFMSKIQSVPFVPDVVLISLTFSCSYDSFDFILTLIKKKWKACQVIAGGNHATATAEILKDDPRIDTIVAGEGEAVIVELVEHLSRFGKIVRPGLIDNLDSIPFPDFDLLNIEKYLTHGRTYVKAETGQRIGTIITSRGCPFRCTYCASHVVHGRKMRYRSVENVMDEITNLIERYQINQLDFADDTLFLDEKRILTILEAIRSKFPQLKVSFPNVLSVNLTTPELIDVMVQCGVVDFVFAVESGSPFTQKHIINKNVDLKKAKSLIEYIRINYPDVNARCTCLLGFPGETKELIQESIDGVKALQPDWIVFLMVTPLPGSVIHQQFVNEGYIKNTPEFWINTHIRTRQFDTKEISAKELRDIQRNNNIEYNMRQNPNLTTNPEKAKRFFQHLLEKYPQHRVAKEMMDMLKK